MHHSLRLYSRYREFFLRYYIFQAKWTKIPLIGEIVRKVANAYGKNAEGAYLLTLGEANEIVDSSKGLAVGPCACRTLFKNCDNLTNTEIMVGLDRNIFVQDRPHQYQAITKEEAKRILEQCHEAGLVHTIIKCRTDFYAICNCCSCCCVPMRLSKEYGIRHALTKSNDIVQQFRKSHIT